MEIDENGNATTTRLDLRSETERVVAREPDRPPPVHEAPEQTPQPMQGLVSKVGKLDLDIGALIARTDAIESTVRRVDRQTIMLVGALALVLYTTRTVISKLVDLEAAVMTLNEA
jgi:hypothetical protein